MTVWHKKWAGEKYYCQYTTRDSVRSSLLSIKDWMLNFRTCCKASGYRSDGCQCQSRIHASNSTFKSHLDTAAATPEVPINVWTQQEAAGCQDSMLCSLPLARQKQPVGWNCSGGWIWAPWPALLQAPTGNVWMTLGSRVCVYRKQQIKNKKHYTQGAFPVLLGGRVSFLTPNLIIGLALSMCVRHKSRHLYDSVLKFPHL